MGIATTLLLAATAASLTSAITATHAEDAAPYEANVTLLTQKVYGDDAYPVWHRRLLPPETPRARYPGFKPETVVLEKGSNRREGAKSIPCDILLERDVAVKLRDGNTIYTDIFRPTTNGTYPAIVHWSPYGKEIGNQHLDDVPDRYNVPLSSVSELQKWEANDPAEWVCNGYAILQPDTRGAISSTGNFPFWGRQLAEDGYDFIEWAADQTWSSGKIGMSGNSWLTVSQWFIAAERPPHLTAIAPWEGFSDVLREQAVRGGMPQLNFNEDFIEIQAGNHFIDDTLMMSLAEPNDTLYWRDKTARLENIEIPAYVVASYENVLHTHGTFEGFRKIQSENKWLRVHNSHEWYDLYQNDSQSELLQYFDYYLKGIDNGWEETPQIRVSLLDPNGTDIVNRVVEEWPPSEYEFSQLYLQPNNTMLPEPGTIAANVSYHAVNGSAIFQVPIKEESELLGYMKLRLWVEAVGSDDMDLYITVTKVSADGDALLRTLPQGGTSISAAYQYSRVSRRQLDTDKSTESEPVLLFQGEQMLSPGEIVPVDIGLWPLGLRIHAGERLQVTVEPGVDSIGGPAFGSAEIPVPQESFTFMPTDNITFVTLGDPTLWAPDWVAEQAPSQTSRNNGTHVIHMGGQYDSHLLVPLKTVSQV